MVALADSSCGAEWSPVEAGLRLIRPSQLTRRPTVGATLTQGMHNPLHWYSELCGKLGSPAVESFVAENQNIADQYTVLSCDDACPTTQHSALEFTPSPTQHSLIDEVSHEPITSTEDAFYLDRYCYILCSWLDVFDAAKHFSLVVPHLCLAQPVLRLSALAWASKQYYLTHLTQAADTSLSYCDRALQMLTTSLNDMSQSSSQATFASCLLLAICELMGDSYRDWQLHLEGTYSLVLTHGWHGCSGGLGGACFWIYCRMDVLSSLATAESTRLDTSLWLLRDDALAPCDMSEAWGVDAWANYAIFLLAQVHNLLCSVRETDAPDTFPSLTDTWNILQGKMEIHKRRQPLQFKPLAVLEGRDSNETPFPNVRFLNETISLGTQFFDIAELLLILARPERSRRDRADRYRMEAKTFMTLAKRVVAVSISNRHEINWIGATQLLSVAGMALHDWSERKALLQCLKDMHLQTGWNTREVIDGLLAWWGWAAPLDERGQSWSDIHEEIGPYASAGEWMLRMYDCGVIMKAARGEVTNLSRG